MRIEKKRKGINDLEHISALLTYFVQASIFHFELRMLSVCGKALTALKKIRA